MATDKRQFTLRMQPENFDKIRVIAALNKRSVAMQIEYLLEQYIADYEASHGQINLVGTGKNVGIVQHNNNGMNFFAIDGGVSYGTISR